jgi:hypothetical protein
VLPYAPKNVGSGVSDYHCRRWGGGWPLDFGAPRYACPMTLLLRKDPSGQQGQQPSDAVHWAARLLLDEALEDRARGGERFEGMVRFVADNSQHMFASYATSDEPVNVAKLGEPDGGGGWTISGSGRVAVPTDGHYGFSLYGAAPGVRVAWAAASLARA